MSGKILVIGSLNVDMVVNVSHMPAIGETIITSHMEVIPGGKGANQACAAGYLGAEVAMLGAAGDDDYAVIQFQSLQKAGVDVSRIIKKKEVSTGLAFITVDQNGDNHIVVVSGANATLLPGDIDAHIDLLEQCDIVLLQLEVPLETVCHAARLAKSLGKMVILDPAPVPEVFPEELYRYIDVIKPNETEIGMLTHVDCREANLEKAVEKLKDKGVKEVLVTLGKDGVYVDSDSCGICRIHAHKVTALDTTAAGDSFSAALACMLAQGKNIYEAAMFANTVSAIVVTRKGAQSSMPRLEEVYSYIKENVS